MDQVHVGADLYAPGRVDLNAPGRTDIGADVRGVLLLDGGRYVVQELRITRQDGGAPVTSELIRRIPVQTLIREMVSGSVRLMTRHASPKGSYRQSFGPVRLSADERRRMVEAGPTDETLLWVARFYLMAGLAGDPPAKSVKENLDIPTSTAGYWIRRAKDRGILGQPNDHG